MFIVCNDISPGQSHYTRVSKRIFRCNEEFWPLLRIDSGVIFQRWKWDQMYWLRPQSVENWIMKPVQNPSANKHKLTDHIYYLELFNNFFSIITVGRNTESFRWFFFELTYYHFKYVLIISFSEFFAYNSCFIWYRYISKIMFGSEY